MKIQHADDEKLGSEQRQALASINPLLGEINGLVDGWRSSDRPKDQCRAKMFDRRTADALIAALQGDRVHAEELLKAVKAEVLEERTSIGRVEYLRYATLAAIGVFVLFGLLVGRSADIEPLSNFVRDEQMWLAAGMGCLGALFSIALGIRARDMRTDLQRRDNIADAILRIMIGAVSAIILFSFLRSGFIRVEGLEIDDDKGEVLSHAAIIVAFLAGFSERLVSGYLMKTADAAAGAAIPGAGMTSAAAQAAAKPEVEATERNPRGRLEVEISGASGAGTAAAAAVSELDAEDNDEADRSVSDLEIAPEELTEDVELPMAVGGVEEKAA